MDTIYKEYSNGQWNYRLWSFDEQRYYHLSKDAAKRLIDRGAKLVVVE